jgi:hypothetical protein
MAGILKKVLRAAVAQPWEYVGEGAPNDWEFRVSPDERVFAMYVPETGLWQIIDTVTGRKVAEATTGEMDRHTGDWRQFLSVEDPDE